MFGDVLFVPGDRLVSRQDSDTFAYFLHMRHFGFGHLANGLLPQWNPHIYSGVPYAANFQAALFYPPNVVYMALPLAKAVTADFALHVFLLGYFTFFLARAIDLRPTAAFFSGAMLMFSFPAFLRIAPGHLTILAELSWIPLLFCSIEMGLRRPGLNAILVGVISTTMLIFAGHPQYFFMTGAVAAPYVCMRLFGCPQRWKSLGALTLIPALSVLTAAIQLWPAYSLLAETDRSNTPSFGFAASLSFPFENLAMFLTPWLLGDVSNGAGYWGRWWGWEVCAFVGIVFLFLAIYGLIYGKGRLRLLLFGFVFIAFLLAFGSYTPLYKFLYDYMPGISLFRGPARFLVYPTLFLSLLAGIGIERFLENRKGATGIAVAVQILAALMLGGVAWIVWQAHNSVENDLWRALMQRMHINGQTLSAFSDTVYFQATLTGILALLVAAATCVTFSLFLFLSKQRRWAAYACLIVGLVEVFGHARYARPTWNLSQVYSATLNGYYGSVGPEQRVFETIAPTHALSLRGYNAWGYDPFMFWRYDLFARAMTGNTLLRETINIPYPNLFRIVRCALATSFKNGAPLTAAIPQPLPRFSLMTRYAVASSPAEVIEKMTVPAFDPTQIVILETPPSPEPEQGGEQGTVQVTGESTDEIRLRVDLPRPAILLVTDSYAKGWRCEGSNNPTQKDYRVLPADLAVRAIPLAAGPHQLRLVYAPLAFTLGKWTTLLSSATLGLLAIAGFARNRAVSLPELSEAQKVMR